MRQRIKSQLLFFARSLELTDLMENFIIAAASTILLVRFYLTLTGFPQIGAGGIHIAHMLWGGFLMLVALIFSLSFLNKEAKRFAAIAGGIGFGLFVDEIGKFVTSDNNYFYHPTFALIYIIFVLLVLSMRSIMKFSELTDKEYAMNALEVMKEMVFYDLDDEEKIKALDYLAKSDPKNPVVATLRETLMYFPAQDTLVDISWVSVIKKKLKQISSWWMKNEKAGKIVVWVFIIMSTLRFISALAGIEFEWDFWEWGRHLSTLCIFFFVLQGLNFHRRKMKIKAYETYQKAAAVSILIAQFFDFYHDQLTALFYLLINLLIYITLHSLAERQKLLEKVA